MAEVSASAAQARSRTASARRVAGPDGSSSLTRARLGLGLLLRRTYRFRRRRVCEHANRPARRSPHHQSESQPCGTAVPPVSWRLQLAIGHQRHVGGADRRLLRLPGVAIDPPAEPALVVDRRDRRVLRRRAGPARELGDLHGVRFPRRAFPAVVAVLQRLATTGADALVPRGIRELLRADRARPSRDPSAVHRAANPSQQLARSAPARGRLHQPDSLRDFH